jgi:glycosyltransferase involved in cell wall biosynthesis
VRHAVAMCIYNQVPEQLELAKQSITSVLAQDIGPLDIIIVNNGSFAPLGQWLSDLAVFISDSPHKLTVMTTPENKSPVMWANFVLGQFFKNGYDKVLCVPDDVKLPENCYRKMAEWPRGLVCGSMTSEIEFPIFEETHAQNECTPLAVTIVRKWFYDALVAKDGYYMDEGFFFYASDCDLALRMASCGIRGVQLDLQYYHFGSGHWKMLEPSEGRKQTMKADLDRQYFAQKWGFACTALEYGASAADINFRGKALV